MAPSPLRKRSDAANETVCNLPLLFLCDPNPRRHPRTPGGCRWTSVARRLLPWLAGFAGIIAASGGDPVWETGAGHRRLPLQVHPGGRPGFSRLASAATGLAFTNHLADRIVATNRVFENGSGVALGDVDGDGWCDIHLCRMQGANALFRNLGGWRFEDITRIAGVECPNQYSTGCALADVDGDSDLDLLVNSIGGGTRLFRNDGHGRFTERTDTRLVRRFGATSMALADIDADGDLDLYVTNYRTDTYRDRPPGLKVEARNIGGRIVVTPEDRFVPIQPRDGSVEVLELGERDFLYLNDGSGGFAPVSWTNGAFVDPDGNPLAAPPRDWGLSVLFRDLNHDGSPDLYVCNDFFQSLDRVWLNRESRGFRAPERGAFPNMSLASMGVDVADINRDGFDDLFVVDMLSRRQSDRKRQRPEMLQGRVRLPIDDPGFQPEVPRNTLFLNRGDGTYAEIAQLSGVSATDWSWSPVFLDVDLDGFEDLLVANGNHHDVQDADVLREISLVRERESAEARLARFPPLRTANLAYRNRGDLTFEEVGAAWGFDWVGVSQGMALGDLDRDGDLDVVVNNLNDEAGLFRNNSSAPRLAIRLRGLPPNTQGIGARIELHGGPVPLQSQEMMSGGRYASSDDSIRTFAASSTNNNIRIEVAWRDGRRTVVSNVTANALYEIHESGAAPKPPRKPEPEPLFEDVSHLLNHVHADPPFDDISRQPLLTHSWSRLGPGVAWVPSGKDGQGPEDLIVGTGAQGRMARFRWDGRGAFSRLESETHPRDQAGFAAWPASEGPVGLLFAESNYENPASGPSLVRHVDTNSDTLALPPTGASVSASAGPIAVGDIDRDGDLDLFVGGRLAAARHPESVASRIYTNFQGNLILDASRSSTLDTVGLVSGAVFGDLDGDGHVELVLACHWGPVRTFRCDSKRLIETTAAWGFGDSRGLWNGVAIGDFNGDGWLDLVASNWGRNSPYPSQASPRARIVYVDIDGDGTVESLEGILDAESGGIVPTQDFETISSALPFVRAKFPTYRAYGEADIAAVLGPHFRDARELAVDTLDSTVFLNRGERFSAIPLPVEAQFAPAFGVSVGDFDGDGSEDLFLAQNFFGVTAEASRYDGGQGLWLRGNGEGGFIAVPGRRSGIRITGEQRGCAIADFDGDGRPDLAVAQNHGPTRLFRNRNSRPGLRIRLAGSEGTGHEGGVGAVIRVVFEKGLGPARAIQAGSGYWSQDAFTQVLATPEHPIAVEVRWPGGSTTRTPIPDGVHGMRIQASGAGAALRR
ncbi:MAG: VCBS repeat-containing protein [Limisphaerales bacterium]